MKRQYDNASILFLFFFPCQLADMKANKRGKNENRKTERNRRKRRTNNLLPSLLGHLSKKIRIHTVVHFVVSVQFYCLILSLAVPHTLTSLNITI